MTPDMKRLCDAITGIDIGGALHEVSIDDQYNALMLKADGAEYIVRAVLLALKGMDWVATEGAERVSQIGDGGWTERADPEQELAAAIDCILA